ncbi:cell division protein FtsX [Bisgaardia hudsonensis]|uniref:Cell division protein FtsX n=1 Tax=Bisgaardia hudsonensis TaxID=109472 RepID=A0A4V2SIZ1_9PAST|nr:permease-like cell division protein FtsX [Bisgaardia hudsonensis]QLB13713.1 cell division protein FtsX [Bisgaardia hudsonensis]TCP12050.1 cell division protein FtsX [Bisgaardia hudsonensis]
MSSRPVYASFLVQFIYSLKSVLNDLFHKKYTTLLTVFVISVSLTIPTVGYLFWKNINNTSLSFYPDAEITVYLHKNLSESDANLVVDKIRDQDGVESLNYISRQQSLNEFRNWSGFSDGLDILDDNPLPAVVTVKPTTDYNQHEKRDELRRKLNSIKGIQEVHLDNSLFGKFTALSWLVAQITILGTILMFLSVFLIISNSISADIYSKRANIEVSKLLGATDQFVLRPFLYTGIIYGILGGLFACIFSAAIILYFKNAIQYVTDLFSVTFQWQGIRISELFFLMIVCSLMGYVSAWISANKYIRILEKKN